MTQTAESRLTGLFDQGVQTFGEALKAGVKIQEEIAKWWTDALDQAGPVQEWQKKGRSIVSEAIPAAQRSAEEWLKIFEQNYRRSMDLMKKAFAREEGETPADLQAKTQELWEASVDMVRESTQAMAQANVKMMEAWAEVLRKSSNGHMIK